MIEVRRERVHVEGAGEGARLFYASDLHLRQRDSERAARLVELAREERPDAILLGGDLVDSPRGHECLGALVSSLGRIAPVLAVAGGHDVFWGVRAVRRAVRRAGGVWLDDGGVELPTRGGRLRIEGRLGVERGADGVPRVLCGHDPAVFRRAAGEGFALVLAGHLHGGQVVLAERGGRLYPGAFVYRWCGLRFDEHASSMLVSRGVADTLPFRFRCPREVLSCEIRSH